MEFLFRSRNSDGSSMDRMIDQGVQMCPFLRNIIEPTNFSFSSPSRFPTPVKGARGPIFEDGPDFETAFRLFHGRDGVVPLSGRSSISVSPESLSETENNASTEFHQFAAPAATISLSAFGAGWPFGFDSFIGKRDNKKKKRGPSKNHFKSPNEVNFHEASGIEWLQTGKCPIAKSYQAVSKVLPLVANLWQPPPGMKFRCPPAVVAARAAIARTAFAKSLRPKPLPAKMFAIGLLGMAANVPLGVWREHTQKFSPAWFIAIHAAIPFVAMLRKAVNMPKSAMVFTFAAAILGQMIGSRAERARLNHLVHMPTVVHQSVIDEHKDTETKVATVSNTPIGISESYQNYEYLSEETKSLVSGAAFVTKDDKDKVSSHCGEKIWDTIETSGTNTDIIRAY
eukprot:TRINITY_DN16511_c0_g1_i1.p1 TRINITY_DN16511_c0_g1~~TRINITY_DN16511_c0_g1_i1.p1  ORF type:complete len:397 (+),score=94.53 TRINITY_DN16511_c0_g1_i1:340-1530(+)